MNGKSGVLLINLGTPDSPETGDVRRYLRQFLSDPRVLDIHPVARWLLLNLVILPTRPAKSSHAYKKIWTERGSPLLFHSLDLVEKVRALLGVPIELAMRYQNPSIEKALTSLIRQDVTRIQVLPLYPQYASSSTGSSLEELFRIAGRMNNVPPISVVPEFFDHPAFIRAFTAVARPILDEMQPDHLLLSFHGLPERHMTASDTTGGAHCLRSSTCCDAMGPANRHCYRAQCFATARALTSSLGLPMERVTVSFQSRLGRTPWIKPYTDLVLPELAKKGVKKLAVMCPAFVADCLETLEEIGIRAKADFIAAGGSDLRLIPSLNAHPAWVQAVTDLLRENATALSTENGRLAQLPQAV